jgi:hypothetical protein
MAKVKVLAAFYHRNDLHEVGAEPDLPDGTAAEMVGVGKAEYVEPPVVETIAPAVTITETKPADVKPGHAEVSSELHNA